jgi:type II secretory pathway pseudopilin PulG
MVSLNLPHNPCQSRAFTKIEFLVVLSIIALLVGILTPVLKHMRDQRIGPRNSANLRGIHQAMLIFAENNNKHLPGLDASGNILPAHSPAYSSIPRNTLTGASFSARYYTLLNGSFVQGQLLINPLDTFSWWSTGDPMPTPDQFSYPLLRLSDSRQGLDTVTHSGRAIEWRSTYNSQAILLIDRNTGSASTANQARSVWSDFNGQRNHWLGHVLWGDNHAEFHGTPRLGENSLNTKYANIINTDDFLFSSDALPGKSSTASAVFGYTSENF